MQGEERGCPPVPSSCASALRMSTLLRSCACGCWQPAALAARTGSPCALGRCAHMSKAPRGTCALLQDGLTALQDAQMLPTSLK